MGKEELKTVIVGTGQTEPESFYLTTRKGKRVLAINKDLIEEQGLAWKNYVKNTENRTNKMILGKTNAELLNKAFEEDKETHRRIVVAGTEKTLPYTYSALINNFKALDYTPEYDNSGTRRPLSKSERQKRNKKNRQAKKSRKQK